MRLISNYKVLACSATLLVGISTGCGGSDGSSLATNAAPSAAAVVTEVPAAETPAPDATAPSGTSPTSDVVSPTVAAGSIAVPSADPCELLTPAIATQALGVPAGEPITQPGEGNTTCAYRPADAGAQSLVVLTLYGVTGSEAVLDAAAAQFPGAEPVDGLGDAARISMQSQAIGVLSGTTVFAVGLYPQQADGQLLPITKDQLVAVARAVLDGQ
jgi:hypothetical protein